MTKEQIKTCIDILVAETTVSIAHECIHICQNIDISLVSYKPYNDVIEEDAIMRSLALSKKLLPNIPEELWILVNKTGYAKGLLYTIKDLASLSNDLHRYYLMNFRGTIFQFYFNTDKMDNLLEFADDITILNQVNGADEIIYIKSNGVFFEPSPEYTRLVTSFKLNPEGVYDRLRGVDIGLEYDYRDEDDYLGVSIRVSGSYLLPGLIKDIYEYYGIAPIYTERAKTLDELQL